MLTRQRLNPPVGGIVDGPYVASGSPRRTGYSCRKPPAPHPRTAPQSGSPRTSRADGARRWHDSDSHRDHLDNQLGQSLNAPGSRTSSAAHRRTPPKDSRGAPPLCPSVFRTAHVSVALATHADVLAAPSMQSPFVPERSTCALPRRARRPPSSTTDRDSRGGAPATPLLPTGLALVVPDRVAVEPGRPVPHRLIGSLRFAFLDPTGPAHDPDGLIRCEDAGLIVLVRQTVRATFQPSVDTDRGPLRRTSTIDRSRIPPRPPMDCRSSPGGPTPVPLGASPSFPSAVPPSPLPRARADHRIAVQSSTLPRSRRTTPGRLPPARAYLL